MTTTVRMGRHTLEVGNPQKELFGGSGITKLDLVDYYRRVSDVLLPHLRDRPITLHRFPDGIEEDGFYQKKIPDHFPSWIHTEEIRTQGGDTLRQLIVDDGATLVYLADQACITIHPWLSRIGALRRPDRMVFDLDPPENMDPKEGFGAIRSAARRIRDLLRDVELVGFVQTSGSRGLHVHVPLDGSASFDTARTFAQDVVSLLARRHRDVLTDEQRKKKRGDRIFLDVGRNAYGQTAVAPYAIRARPKAPVATPLRWDELDRSDLHSERYTVKNLFRRLARMEDPWKGMGRRGRALQNPRELLDGILAEAEDEDSRI